MIDGESIPKLVRMCSACPKMCRHVCPTFFAWRSDSPTPHGRALLVHYDEKRVRPLDERGIEVLYQCLECSHCLTWCLPEIDIAKIVETTRVRLVSESRQPAGLNRLESDVRKHHNPYGEKHSGRADWMEGRIGGKVSIAYFSGCTSAYREQQIAKDTVAVLSSLGYSVRVNPDEWCCGSPLLRTGFVETAMEQARHNMEVFNAMDVEEIVVTCPGCYRVLTKDYPAHGLEITKPIRHLSEVLESRIKDLESGSITGTVTYHDPCHLGRHCGIYEQPRSVINRVSGGKFVEMERSGDNAMCCGNGAGLRALFPDKAKAIGVERVHQALQIGADTLVTSCPFCKNMLSGQAGADLTVYDLSEFVIMAQKGEKVHK
ncbi:MAG: (Fe-S)-binding protein [Candidatus Sifarchaeia archaeon]